MPTVAELERLDALIKQLQPLALKQRGELIAAADWNVAIGALIEVARATLTSGESDTVAAHEHNDQVSIGWLDPRVRQLVTGGGITDPAIDSEFRKLRRDLTGVVTRLDRVGAEVDTARTRLAEVATNDIVRDAAVTRIDRKVLGAAESREDIADLRTTLRTLETEVGRAVEVGALLEVNGQTVDVPGLVERVAAVETLRDRLTRPDGELLDATTFEQRLAEVQGSLVTSDALTTALADLRDDIGGGGFDLNEVLDAARGAGRVAATESVNTLGTELRSSISTRFGEIDATVEAAVSRSTTALVDTVAGRVRSDIEPTIASGDAAVRAAIEAALDQRITAANQLVDQRLNAISASVTTQVAGELDTRLAAALGAFDTRVAGIETSVGQLSTRASSNESAISDLDTRFQSNTLAEATAARRGPGRAARPHHCRREWSRPTDHCSGRRRPGGVAHRSRGDRRGHATRPRGHAPARRSRGGGDRGPGVGHEHPLRRSSGDSPGGRRRGRSAPRRDRRRGRRPAAARRRDGGQRGHPRERRPPAPRRH